MKKIVICCVMIICSLATMGQGTITHTVVRGEDLDFIAEKYGITKEQILEANPNAAELFYTGMTLKIPAPSQVIINDGGVLDTQDMPRVDDGFISSADFTFMFNPDDKVYGLRANVNCLGTNWLSANAGVSHAFVDHGSFGVFVGAGLSPKYAVGPVIVGAHLYPYVTLYTSYEAEEVKNNSPTYRMDYEMKNKVKFNYGGALDLMAGYKIANLSAGNNLYLTVSYHVSALEFKTKDCFKHGLWGVGVSIEL